MKTRCQQNKMHRSQNCLQLLVGFLTLLSERARVCFYTSSHLPTTSAQPGKMKPHQHNARIIPSRAIYHRFTWSHTYKEGSPNNCTESVRGKWCCPDLRCKVAAKTPIFSYEKSRNMSKRGKQQAWRHCSSTKLSQDLSLKPSPVSQCTCKCSCVIALTKSPRVLCYVMTLCVWHTNGIKHWLHLMAQHSLHNNSAIDICSQAHLRKCLKKQVFMWHRVWTFSDHQLAVYLCEIMSAENNYL